MIDLHTIQPLYSIPICHIYLDQFKATAFVPSRTKCVDLKLNPSNTQLHTKNLGFTRAFFRRWIVIFA